MEQTLFEVKWNLTKFIQNRVSAWYRPSTSRRLIVHFFTHDVNVRKHTASAGKAALVSFVWCIYIQAFRQQTNKKKTLPWQQQLIAFIVLPHLLRLHPHTKQKGSSRLLQVEHRFVLRLNNKAVTKTKNNNNKKKRRHRKEWCLRFSMLDQSSIDMHIVQRNRSMMLTIFIIEIRESKSRSVQ